MKFISKLRDKKIAVGKSIEQYLRLRMVNQFQELRLITIKVRTLSTVIRFLFTHSKDNFYLLVNMHFHFNLLSLDIYQEPSSNKEMIINAKFDIKLKLRLTPMKNTLKKLNIIKI